MIVYNKTVLNEEEVFSSLVSQTRKGQLKKFILTAIIIGCGIPLLIFGILQDDTNYLVVGIAFLIFSLFHAVMTFIAIFKAPKNVKIQNKAILSNSMTYDYIFKEQSFQVNITAGEKITKLPYKYDDVKKIYEYDTRYEIKLADNMILFVYKSGFTAEKSEDFFIKNLTKNKKKIKNRRKK